ncbi:phosphoglycerate mutase [Volvox carteri f. nagariensis]|uniref:Phosphoglycerate mutase n=1 Tax=Volvox carteri f. nagariensis TaxID=3068 RepID=D8U3F8_VOLCA|nr:phosphoglycerate mutase [Volvox carteri f. nagariensis]EFJ45746.1 phosphoglycerate mutase [Volvox carteri f. nagariensis]|eukprot:XP_002953147.1 phosphoglycerate mutase [Volvox carteri f. nagariensis]
MTGAVPGPGDRLRASSVAISGPASLSLWNGIDEFTCFKDRIDAPPLPMPSITEPVRVVIVRHGQSTWNAEGRIQGSTDLSVLTEKGIKQAEKTRDMLSSMRFSAVFQSPLARARQTADVVLQGQSTRMGEEDVDAEEDVISGSDTVRRITLPSLREIDLYHFQGLLKHEGKALYGDQYSKWQKEPHTFELNSHAPVRELWHRASLAWRNLLQRPQQGAGGSTVAATAAAAGRPAAEAVARTDPRVVLVVAHNAINQALVATALGLPPSYFRRLPQNNAALSVIDLEPSTATVTNTNASSGVRITLSCLNQSPDNPFKNPDKVLANVVLVTPPSSSHPQRRKAQQPPIVAKREMLLEVQEEVEEELRSLAAVLSKLQVTHVLAGPGVSAATATALLAGQQPPPSVKPPPEHAGRAGDGGSAAAVEFLPSSAPAEAIWQRAVSSLVTAAPPPPPGDARSSSYGNVLVVLDAESHPPKRFKLRNDGRVGACCIVICAHGAVLQFTAAPFVVCSSSTSSSSSSSSSSPAM